MHKLTSLELSEQFGDDYIVDKNIVKIVQSLIDVYNKTCKLEEEYDEVNICRFRTKDEKITYVPFGYNNGVEDAKYDKCDATETGEFIGKIDKNELFRIIIANCPQGLMKVMRITTNALQLKSIINQRAHHKLAEWREFCQWAKNLYFWRYLGMYVPDKDNRSTEDDRMDVFDNLFSLWLQNVRYCKITESNDKARTYVPVEKDDPNSCELKPMLVTAYKDCIYFDRGFMYANEIYSNHAVISLMSYDIMKCQRIIDELTDKLDARNQEVTKLKTFITDFIVDNKTDKPTKKLPKLDVEPGITLFTDKSSNTKRECNRMWLSEDRSKCHTGHIKLDLLDD